MRISGSTASSHDRYEHVAMVPNMLLSPEDDVSPVPVTNTEGEEDGTVGCTPEGRREECSVLSMSFELELRSVREENASLAATVNEYKVLVNNLEWKMNEEKLNTMTLLQKVNPSKEEVEWLYYQNKLLRQTTIRVLDSAVREVGTFPRYVK